MSASTESLEVEGCVLETIQDSLLGFKHIKAKANFSFESLSLLNRRIKLKSLRTH